MGAPPPTITIAAPPTTQEVALTLLQWMFSQTGTLTDYNIGSIVRTYAEAVGAVQEVEGVSSQAQAFQALVYSAYTAFGIVPLTGTSSAGSVTFSTLSNLPLPAGLNVSIPAGTIVQAINGTQFSVSSSVILTSGMTSISTNVASSQTGSITNVVSGSIIYVSSSLSYPLAVINNGPTSGGTDVELPSQTLGRFTAFVQSLGLASPIAIAGSVIGVTYSNNGVVDTVEYSTCYEQWIIDTQNGLSDPTIGFTVYIDDGSGAPTTQLINTVYNYLSNGGVAGFRPAGIPYSVASVIPVSASVSVTVTSLNPSLNPSIETAIEQAVQVYFASLGFGEVAESTQLIAGIANVTFGQISSLQVELLDYDSLIQTTVPPALTTTTTGSVTFPSSTIIPVVTTFNWPQFGQIILNPNMYGLAGPASAVVTYTNITPTSFTGCTTTTVGTFGSTTDVIFMPMSPASRVILQGTSVTVN